MTIISYDGGAAPHDTAVAAALNIKSEHHSRGAWVATIMAAHSTAFELCRSESQWILTNYLEIGSANVLCYP